MTGSPWSFLLAGLFTLSCYNLSVVVWVFLPLTLVPRAVSCVSQGTCGMPCTYLSLNCGRQSFALCPLLFTDPRRVDYFSVCSAIYLLK